MQEDLEELQSFQFSIVIENDLDYISEKVWKSIYAGAVPIYVGPKLTNDQQLEDIVLSSAADLSSIKSGILNYDQTEIVRKREAGFKF